MSSIPPIEGGDERALGAFLADITCLDEIENVLGKPNIFDVLGIARTEIRHSNVLRWLLDPHGTHGFGSLFLRLFLQNLGKIGADPIRLLSANLDTFYVVREYKHIDILLFSKEGKVAIAIENKVDTGEHDNQLARYEKTVNSDFENFYKVFVFLTPDGEEASGGNWRALGYKAIYDALKYCLERIDVGNEAKLLLSQYMNLLEREFMNRDELMDVCNKIYRQHKQALDLIFEMREDHCANTFSMLLDWFDSNPQSGLSLDRNHSSKSLLRFTTSWLVAVVPALTGEKKSGWNSDYSAYYELMNRKNGLACKLVVSSVGLEAKRFEQIKTTFNMSDDDFPEGWKWKTIYRFAHRLTLNDDADESIDKEQVSVFMDKLSKAVSSFESKRMLRLA